MNMRWASGLHPAPGLCRWLQEDEVLSETADRILNTLLGALPDGHQDDDGRHPNDHAERRQDAPKAVGGNRPDSHSKRIKKAHPTANLSGPAGPAATLFTLSSTTLPSRIRTTRSA